MALRFRKSYKIAPGVRVNMGKKSIGMSVGGKMGGVSFNSKSGTRVRASAPGTGLSYSTKISGSKSSSKKQTKPPTQKAPVPQRWWYIALAVVLFLGGIGSIGSDAVAGIVGILLSAVMAFFSSRSFKNNPQYKYDVPAFQNQFRIFKDSLKLLMETENPETFFSRYDVAETAAQKMAAITDAPVIEGESPQDLVEALHRQKAEIVNAFLDRYAKAVRIKAFELSRGRSQKLDSFNLITSEYEDRMPPESIQYRDELYSDMKAKLAAFESGSVQN